MGGLCGQAVRQIPQDADTVLDRLQQTNNRRSGKKVCVYVGCCLLRSGRVKSLLIKNHENEKRQQPSQTDEGKEKGTGEKGKANLTSNWLPNFVRTDFEIRLDVTEANEKK